MISRGFSRILAQALVFFIFPDPGHAYDETARRVSKRSRLQRAKKMELWESLEHAEAEPKDLGFVIRGPTLEAVFQNASEQLLAATVERRDFVRNRVTVELKLVDDTLELLLSRFLEQLISLRETRGLLLRASNIQLQLTDEVALCSDLSGETIEVWQQPVTRHVKAAFVRQLRFNPGTGNWEVSVRLDV
jgi:SHS2 domain-containing protein